ncbi:hypothetical protein GCM10007108_12960 [Thermogymnomonas acidicola]|uniref:Uncharacterized protein n=1 Tax=Thermogymnomonas acidicola TaxID=399579 RepID=A0AA37BS08_9ARCH|nr:hypothetical protein [Thermogymnomonas acidicola]GGM76438.1 hypothetical protein GCM10007108_12960 [Thermogymnomonas acidicola]
MWNSRGHALAVPVFASAVVISAGAAVMRYRHMVPLYLTVATYTAATALMVVGFLVALGSRKAAWAAFALAFAGMAVSTNPAHIRALAAFGTGPFISAADITMVVGFYALPAVYVVMFLLGRRAKGGGVAGGAGSE